MSAVLKSQRVKNLLAAGSYQDLDSDEVALVDEALRHLLDVTIEAETRKALEDARAILGRERYSKADNAPVRK